MRGVLLFNNVFFVRGYFLIILNMNAKVSKARCKHHFLFVMVHLFAGSYWTAVKYQQQIIWNSVYYSINLSDN